VQGCGLDPHNSGNRDKRARGELVTVSHRPGTAGRNEIDTSYREKSIACPPLAGCGDPPRARRRRPKQPASWRWCWRRARLSGGSELARPPLLLHCCGLVNRPGEATRPLDDVRVISIAWQAIERVGSRPSGNLPEGLVFEPSNWDTRNGRAGRPDAAANLLLRLGQHQKGASYLMSYLIFAAIGNCRESLQKKRLFSAA